MSDEETMRRISRQLDDKLAMLQGTRADTQEIIKILNRMLARAEGSMTADQFTAERCRAIGRLHEAFADQLSGIPGGMHYEVRKALRESETWFARVAELDQKT
jgi:hypothetical protein